MDTTDRKLVQLLRQAHILPEGDHHAADSVLSPSPNAYWLGEKIKKLPEFSNSRNRGGREEDPAGEPAASLVEHARALMAAVERAAPASDHPALELSSLVRIWLEIGDGTHATALARTIADPNSRALAYCEIALYLLTIQQRPPALVLLQEAEDLLPEIPDECGELAWLGQELVKGWAGAHKWARAVQAAARIPPSQEKARAMYALGVQRYAAGQVAQAVQDWQAALTFPGGGEEEWQQAETMKNVAKQLWRAGETARAWAGWELAIRVAQAGEHGISPQNRGASATMLQEIAEDLGQLQQRERAYAVARAIADDHKRSQALSKLDALFS